ADRVEAADDGVGRVVLHSEKGRIDTVDDLQEDVLRLRELGVLPRAVLVVVLQAQHDAAPLGVVERAPDALDGPFDTLLAGQARVALAAEGAAVADAEGDAQVDGRLLPPHLAGALRGRAGR